MLLCTVESLDGAYMHYADIARQLHCRARPVHSLIVDDASSIAEMRAALLMQLGAHNLLMIGDEFQMAPRVCFAAKRHDSTHQFSLMSRASEAGLPCHVLTWQYRLAPSMCAFINVRFNLGNYLPMPFVRQCMGYISGYCWHDVRDDPDDGEQHAGAKHRMAEVKACLSLATIIRREFPTASVDVLTVYPEQLELFERVAERTKAHGYVMPYRRVAQVRQSQGREADFVLISLVNTRPRHSQTFLNDARFLCMAWTRARKSTVFVGDREAYDGTPEWQQIVRACHNLVINNA